VTFSESTSYCTTVSTISRAVSGELDIANYPYALLRTDEKGDCDDENGFTNATG